MAKDKTTWKKAVGTMRVVAVKLKAKDETLKCFVLQCEKGLTLVQLFDFDARFCGYSVITENAVERVKVSDEGSLLDSYARLRRFKPRLLEGVKLTTIAEALETLSEKFPLVTLVSHKKGRVKLLTGKIIGKTKSKFSFKIIDDEGFWRNKTKEFSFKSISQIRVGSGFENALTLISEQRQPKKRVILYEN